MQHEGVEPDPVTFVGVLNACASVVALDEGRRTHDQIIQGGWESDVFVGSAMLICMQNVGAWRRLGGCSTRCLHKMWSPGMP
jgi:hypothetical protein